MAYASTTYRTNSSPGQLLCEGAFNICTRTNFTPTLLLSMTYPLPVHEESRSVLLFSGGGGVKDVDLRKLHCAYALN